MKRWISEKARRGISAAAALLLTASAAVSACALGEPNITADTTIGEIRANESIIGSGFNTMDRSAYWPEQPWEYTSWTLQEYLGDCAPDAAAGLNLLIENYNSGVQVTYKIYTPEEIAADPSKDQVELYYFPGKQPGGKYALVMPGNMFEKSAKMREGCATCYHLHEMGYASFILRYSVGEDNHNNAAYKDLVRAIQFITQHADALSAQLIQELRHSVTVLPAQGMFSRTPKQLLICVVNRHQIVQFQNILQEFPDTFAYVSTVSETLGNFKLIS